MYKTLLQGGHFSRDTNSVQISPHWKPLHFAEAWVKMVGPDITLAAAQAGGTFVVAELVERIVHEGLQDSKDKLKSWFNSLRENIKKWDAKGSHVLAEKVEALFM